ncbi:MULTISPECIES: SA1362 family protein [unclassified Sporolactobacillus]|uniref:SA1362 family protein n=1 Tax=unclassified Sporolactobacillus TaxID=2628533 RepID=UPI002367CB19|nr:SA1362 family protein [Sporolactobacillus sp. CQH2019]MDD9149286.1 hypothetical protein [Sporolactobacillus sp. CQH2019]
MKTFLYSLVFFLIVALGLFGLLASFLNNSTALLVQLLIIAAIAAAGLFFFRRLAGGSRNEDRARYRKAAKQSIRRRKLSALSRKVRGIHPSKLRVISNRSRNLKEVSRQSIKDHGHLTVIDGKKNKKKKRVLF